MTGQSRATRHNPKGPSATASTSRNYQRLMGTGLWECPFVAENANVGATGRLACCSARATSSASAAEFFCERGHPRAVAMLE